MTRLLIVEDNFASRELLAYLLRAHGFEVATASDGRAGLELLDDFAPHAVLSDIGMPVMSGYLFAATIRSHPRRDTFKLIAVTALSMPGDSGRALAAGFDGYVSKPIDPETIVSTILGYLAADDREPDAA
jgi:two-component system cell cycle response regulator